VIVVDDDLPRAPLKADVLRPWLLAIAAGRKVVVKQTKSSIEFKAGAKVPVKFRLSGEFTQKHRGLAKELRRIVARTSSKWAEVGQGGFSIRDLHGLRFFFWRMCSGGH